MRGQADGIPTIKSFVETTFIDRSDDLYVSLDIPRSLHKALKEAAEMEGVSLNQYMLYKLSR